jgi:hypothetical protein
MRYRLTAGQVETFQRDGVLYLPGIVSPEQVAQLREACDRVMARPTSLGADLTPLGKQGRFFGDFFVWRRDPVFCDLAMHSALPAVAQQLMRSSKVNLVWDHLLVKEPHTEVETPWHHDQPYAWCNGTQNCSFWVSLDHVTDDSGAVEYIRGSHRWGRWFEAVSFNPGRSYSSGSSNRFPTSSRSARTTTSPATTPNPAMRWCSTCSPCITQAPTARRGAAARSRCATPATTRPTPCAAAIPAADRGGPEARRSAGQ